MNCDSWGLLELFVRFYDSKEKARTKQWYRCTVAKVNDNGSCNLKYDDGDKESNVLPVNIVFMNRGKVKYALASTSTSCKKRKKTSSENDSGGKSYWPSKRTKQ